MHRAQNADDARASTVRFCLDLRTHSAGEAPCACALGGRCGALATGAAAWTMHAAFPAAAVAVLAAAALALVNEDLCVSTGGGGGTRACG